MVDEDGESRGPRLIVIAGICVLGLGLAFVGAEFVLGFDDAQHDGTISSQISLTAAYDESDDSIRITHEGGDVLHGDVPVFLTVDDPDSGVTTRVPLVSEDSKKYGQGLAQPPVRAGDSVRVSERILVDAGQSSGLDQGDQLSLRFVVEGSENETYRLGTVEDNQSNDHFVAPAQ